MNTAINGTVGTHFNHTTKAEYRCFETDNLFGEKYQAKQNNTFGHTFLSCVFCGRDTSKQGKSSGVMVGAGGALIVHPEDYEIATDGGAMGWFPVGSECIKSVPAEFRIANIYDDKVNGV
jgi:hypothetical protein